MSKDPYTKIHEEYENPYDNIMIKLASSVSEYFKKLNFTPNNLTTLSIIFCLISIYFINKISNQNKQESNEINLNSNKLYKILAFIFYLLSYFFDCLDGYYARKYDMVTDFGDKYDHYSDILKSLLLFYVFYLKMSKTKFIIFTVIISIVIIGMFIHLGCQEKYHTNNNGSNGHYLEQFKNLCINKPETTMKYTKYFGCGTATIVVAIFILLI